MSLEMETMWDAMKQSHYKRTLEAIQKGIQNAANPYDAMETALRHVAEAVHAQAGTFWFHDRFGDDLIHATAVYGGADMSDITLMPGEGIAGTVIKSTVSMIVEDCENDERWTSRVDRETGFVTKTMMCVPLKIDSLCFGCIQIINKTDGLIFDTADLNFAQELAGGAAEMLSTTELLRGYIVYAGRQSEDTITYESIVTAPTYSESERLLGKTNCYHILNREEKTKVNILMHEVYDLFEGALDRKEGRDTSGEQVKKRGLFSRKR